MPGTTEVGLWSRDGTPPGDYPVRVVYTVQGASAGSYTDVVARLSKIMTCKSSNPIVAQMLPMVGCAIVDREEGLCPALLMTLPRVLPQEFVQVDVAAIEGLAIMRLCDRFFMPWGKPHPGFGIAEMAARNLAFGKGGATALAVISQ